MGQPLRKQVWNILENLKIDQPSHPAIPLLDMYSKDLANTCSAVFTDGHNFTILRECVYTETQTRASGVEHGLTLLHGWPDWWRRWWKHGAYTRIAHKRTVWCTRLKRSWSRSKPERSPGQWSLRLSLGAQWLCSRRCKGHQINVLGFCTWIRISTRGPKQRAIERVLLQCAGPPQGPGPLEETRGANSSLFPVLAWIFTLLKF